MKLRSISIFLCLVICAAAFAIVGGSVSAATPYHDGWDEPGDFAEWIPNTAYCNLEVVDTGGNPGGYLYTWAGGTAGTYTAKEEFSGDYGFAPAIKNSIDLKILSTTNILNGVYLRFRYHDCTYNGWRYRITSEPIFDEWVTYTVVFNPTWSDSEATSAGWYQETSSPSFSETLADVYTTEIRIEGSGGVYACIDNFRMEEKESIDLIIKDVEEMDLPQGVEDSLLSILEAALRSIDTGNEMAAIQQLQAFIRMVEAMSGNKLTEEEANALIAAAQAIIDELTG
jgi:hypothetical protein